jgi:hypothetical protein
VSANAHRRWRDFIEVAQIVRPVARRHQSERTADHIGIDFAVTSNGGDYSVIIVVGMEHPEGTYLLDVLPVGRALYRPDP